MLSKLTTLVILSINKQCRRVNYVGENWWHNWILGGSSRIRCWIVHILPSDDGLGGVTQVE